MRARSSRRTAFGRAGVSWGRGGAPKHDRQRQMTFEGRVELLAATVGVEGDEDDLAPVAADRREDSHGFDRDAESLEAHKSLRRRPRLDDELARGRRGHLRDRLRLRRPRACGSTNRGEVESFDLRDGLSVAAFDQKLHATLARLGIDVQIRESPYGVPMTTPFPEDDLLGRRREDARAELLLLRLARATRHALRAASTRGGYWAGEGSPLVLLPYESVRTADDPDHAARLLGERLPRRRSRAGMEPQRACVIVGTARSVELIDLPCVVASDNGGNGRWALFNALATAPARRAVGLEPVDHTRRRRAKVVAALPDPDRP